MSIWIISDLHLCAQRPAVSQAFLHWLETTVSQSNALYILGDFFEVWIGDDVLDDLEYGKEFLPIVQGLRKLADQGVQLYFMHGNRDFLIGEHFAHTCGLHLLKDPTLLNVGQNRILLSHGDRLCTDDIAYQTFRKQVRSLQWQTKFLTQSLTDRLVFAEQARKQSMKNKVSQALDIMDVNEQAVANLLREHDYPDILLHGHTHRPGIHDVTVDNKPCQRWVLGDWHETASVVHIQSEQPLLLTLTLY